MGLAFRVGFGVLAALLSVGAFLFFAPILGNTRSAEQFSPDNGAALPRVSRDFFWGAAVAAQQVEHQSPSDWTAFEKRAVAEGKTETGSVIGEARPGHIHHLDRMPEEVRTKKTDFDTRFAQDFDTVAAHNHNAFRFSISWSRLFPRADMTEPSPDGIAFYTDLLDALDARGMEPFVTLFHFSTPEWFWDEVDGKRGWERADAMEHWERFVSAVASAYSSRVTYWVTLNEPMVYVYNGYMTGIFPPLRQARKPKDLAPVAAAMLDAHGRAYRILKAYADRQDREIQVGLTRHTRAFEPLRNWHGIDRLAAAAVEQAFIWDFSDALETGILKMTGTDVKIPVEGVAGTQDYTGINYYGRFFVEASFGALSNPVIHAKDPSDPALQTVSDLGWALYPKGFRQVLVKAHKRYNRPIFVLENGLADAADNDVKRQHFLVNHIREMGLAREDGADIRGYFHWSLTDNFEWAEGFGPRFGLVKIDYEDDFARTPRPSAEVFKRIIAARGVTDRLWLDYGMRNE